jgi:DNA-binding Lrp family transcriptional regulator
MSATLESTDLKLLDAIQQEIPLVPRPFTAIAEKLGTNEADVVRRISALKNGERKVIRQISAIFDSRSLGYTSCLVAAKIDEAKIESAAQEINQHPGVSHNYRRNHAYNLWYTVAVPPDSMLGLEKTVDILHQRSGAIIMRLMPALKLFKIGVKFNLTGDSEVTARSEQRAFDSDKQEAAASAFVATDAEKRIIRVLQQDLPIESRPFDLWAKQAETSVDALLIAARRYQALGCMRRFSAVLRHREAGFGANAMGGWVVSADQHEAFGQTAASFAAVSHCYLRPTYEDWPYSIFTMVHGQSPQDCEKVLAEISRATGITNYTALYSSHEYKKVRVKYFMGDIEAWENDALASRCAARSNMCSAE